MFIKFALLALMLFALTNNAAELTICNDAERNLAKHILPGTWRIDYELSRTIFRNVEIPEHDPLNMFEQLRFVSDDSEKVRRIFKTMPGCAYLVGRIEFPLLVPSDIEELEEVYFAVSIEHGNTVIAIADNDQGYRSKILSVVSGGASRADDRIFIRTAAAMFPMSRI